MADYSEAAPSKDPAADDKKPKTGKEAADLLRIAKKQYEDDYDSERHNIEEGYADLNFLAGNQWPETGPGSIKERRDEGRIFLTHNRLPQFIRQITGDMRLNKPAIKVRPVGSGADEECADLLTGLIRNIESQSQGPNVYVSAGSEAARCGQGIFRINTEYADVDMFEQDIRLRYHPNGLAVLFDCNSRMPTREDAQHCFVPTRMTYDAFKEAYPKAAVSSWDEMRNIGITSDVWCGPQEVVVCEYWYKEKETRTLIRMGDGSIFLAQSPPKKFQQPEPEGDAKKITDEEWAKTLIAASVKRREVEVDCVYQCHMTAAEILSGPDKWAGRFLPIIPVVGEEINLGDRVIRHGAIRWAKDPQRTYNYHVTTATEAHALAPKAPFVGTAEQFKGYEKEWRQANKRNLPYLRYNSDPQAGGPPQRSSVSTDITASMVLAERSVDDLHATIGIYPPSLGQKSNETSGKAILARQKESDVGTYLYIDNLATAIAYAGRQLIDLIPHIYDTERVVRIVAEDDTTEEVTINKFDQAQAKVLNDITIGKYDVVVEVGPAFSTRRAEASEQMMNFVQMNPQGAVMFMDLIAGSQDWPLREKFIERAEALLPPGIDEDVDKRRAEKKGPQKPNPMEELAVASEQANIEKTHAETDGKNLDNMKKSIELPFAGKQAAAQAAQAGQPKTNGNGGR